MSYGLSHFISIGAKKMTINELDVVRLSDNREGTVVHIFPGGHAYCVEIVNEKGETLDLVDVEEKEIVAVVWKYKDK